MRGAAPRTSCANPGRRTLGTSPASIHLLGHVTIAVALGAHGVLVDHHEALFGEHHAVGQAQPVDLPICAAGPRAKVSNCAGQSFEGLRALRAEEMDALVLVGSPDLVAHSGALPCGA